MSSDNPAKVRAHWDSAEAFYRERDHRTELEVKELTRYSQRQIEIHVDPQMTKSITIQRTVLVAANLTARWARNVRVVVPNVSLVSPLDTFGDKWLDARILREMSEADPFGNFEISRGELSDPGPLRLFIGPCADAPKTELDYTVYADGWHVLGFRGCTREVSLMQPTVASVAALAGALGAGDLFKRAIGHRQPEWFGQIDWCTWGHLLNHAGPCPAGTLVPAYANLGNLLLGGVGAIGSALLYVLGLMPLSGQLTVLDRDFVETSNLNRSPLFTADDVVVGRLKIDVAVQVLNKLGIQARSVAGTWREHSQRLGRENFDVWVSLTNEDGAWAEVPFQLPPIVLHGTTTSEWGIGVGRHIPRVEDCTACRMPRPHAEFRGPCAEGEISRQGEQPLRASLPFLSTVSAALIATEFLKLDSPAARAIPNAVYADFRFGLPAVISAMIGPTQDCRGCEMSHTPLWLDRGGRGRYSNLCA